MNKTEELKACPFCGGLASGQVGNFASKSPFRYFVECVDCKATAELTKWNTRPASLEPATEKNILMFLVKIFKQTNFLTDIKDPHNVEINGRFDLINIARAFQRFGQPRREVPTVDELWKVKNMLWNYFFSDNPSFNWESPNIAENVKKAINAAFATPEENNDAKSDLSMFRADGKRFGIKEREEFIKKLKNILELRGSR